MRFHTIAQHAGPAGLGENLGVVNGPLEGGKIPELDGNHGAFAPDYAPEEIFEIASKLYMKGRETD